MYVCGKNRRMRKHDTLMLLSSHTGTPRCSPVPRPGPAVLHTALHQPEDAGSEVCCEPQHAGATPEINTIVLDSPDAKQTWRVWELCECDISRTVDVFKGPAELEPKSVFFNPSLFDVILAVILTMLGVQA